VHERKDGESIIKEKAFRKLGEAPEGTQCIDFPKPHNHGVKVKYIYKNYRTNFRESQCIILPSFCQISGTNQEGAIPPLST
jgi:hypothetical protein